MAGVRAVSGSLITRVIGTGPVRVSGQVVGNRWRNRVRDLLERDGTACGFCGRDFSPDDLPSIDHVLPLSKGGRRGMENERLVHRPCNNRRGNDDGESWRAKRARERKVSMALRADDDWQRQMAMGPDGLSPVDANGLRSLLDADR